jgi:hypothetical protein
LESLSVRLIQEQKTNWKIYLRKTLNKSL